MGRFGTPSAALLGLCALLVGTPTWAQADPKPASRTDAVQLRHNLREEINRGLVGIVSEGTDYTVDLALSLAGENNRLHILPIAGVGALQNAKNVIFARGIDFAILQADVLDEFKRHPPFPGVEQYLQYVTRLYDQELHLLAGPDIRSIEDLRGKAVNFGQRDSGTYRTAMAVFDALAIKPEVTNLPHPIALDKLRRGDIAALAYITTKPGRLFQEIRPDENLHFVPITSGPMSNYNQTNLTFEDYPELVSKDAPVKTVSVGTVLVTYNWPKKSERYQRVDRFVQAFFANLKEIKARRPKWREFDITASVSGWTRFPAAEQWLKKAGLSPEPERATAQRHVTLDPQQRDSLFREFAEYQRTARPEKTTMSFDLNQREALFREFDQYQKQQHVMVAYRDPVDDH
jgi:TRAP-type uncharacterized transport system substrate-binding protein